MAVSQSLLHQGIGRTVGFLGGGREGGVLEGGGGDEGIHSREADTRLMAGAAASQSLLHQGIGRTAPPFLIQQTQ